MPDTTNDFEELPRPAEDTLQIIKDIADQALNDGEDLKAALIIISYEADRLTPRDAGHDYPSLTQRTLDWAEDMGIRAEGTAQGQANKMLEEAIETWAAIHHLSADDIEEMKEHAKIVSRRAHPVPPMTGHHAEVRDGFGDVMVTLTNTARAYMDTKDQEDADVAAWTLGCWAEALGIIEQRTGEMIDGELVKSEDLDDDE